MRVHSVWVAIVCLLILFAFAPSSANAQAVVTSGPFALAPFNPCVPSDVIAITGRTTVILYPARRDSSGGLHFTSRTISEGQGTTTNLSTPKNYAAHEEHTVELVVPSGGTLDVTDVHNLAFIRQGEATADGIALGGADDFMLKTTIHLTFNANGVPTAVVSQAPKNGCM
jgi:hypothetical protein